MHIEPMILWFILILIGVFDAREYRIPNSLILLLAGLIIVGYFLYPIKNQQEWSSYISGFAVTFLCSLVFYIFKIMAAGDVKLLSVIGLMLGVHQLVFFAQYIAVSCVFIGGMYWLLNRLQLAGQETQVNYNCNIALLISMRASQFKDDIKIRRNLAYMPFAPVLIVALAMYHYFHG